MTDEIQQAANASPEPINKYPFLALIRFGLLVTPVHLLYLVGQEVVYLVTGGFAAYRPNLGAATYVLIGLAGWGLLTALSVWVAVEFLRRSRKLPRAVIIVAFVHLLLTIVLFLWDTTLAGEVDPTLVNQLAWAVLRTSIIVPYFLFSKAVQGVFVVDAPARKSLAWSEP